MAANDQYIIKMVDSSEKSTTKTFQKIDDSLSNTDLADLGKAYVKLTTGVINTSMKRQNTEISLTE